MTDVVKILIADGAHLPLKLLSVRGCVSEETLLNIISGKVYKQLEILTISHKYLTTNISRLSKIFKSQIKKLNLKGCAIGLKSSTSELLGYVKKDKRWKEDVDLAGDGYQKFAEQRDLYGMRKDDIITPDELKQLQGVNFDRIKVHVGQQCETDQSDELEIVRKRYVKAIQSGK